MAIVLMEHAIGAHPEALTPALSIHMALLQARMHTLGEQYAKTQNMKSGKLAQIALQETLLLKQSEFCDELSHSSYSVF